MAFFLSLFLPPKLSRQVDNLIEKGTLHKKKINFTHHEIF